MTDLEKVASWLQTYPQWAQAGPLLVDYTHAVPGNAGLFPRGLELLRRREDITGNVVTENRYHFALYRVCTGQQDSPVTAQWLLDFQNWVQSQSEAGMAPHFGDVPEREYIRAEAGKLYRANQTGTAMYVVRLSADFTKVYLR